MSHSRIDRVVQFFATCLVDAFYPEAGMAVVEVLEEQGLEVEYAPDQTCCGQPAFNGGFWKEARAMARQTLDVLDATTGPIVVPSGSCTDMIVHHYPELLANDPTYAAIAKTVSARTYEFTQFLVDKLEVSDVGAGCSGCATYHPSCHGLRNLNLRHQAPTLLARVAGLRVVDLPAAAECCGFGGLFAVKMGEISGAMLRTKLDNVEATGADTLVGSDVSCLMHMAGGLKKRGSRIQVKYIAEILRSKTQKAGHEDA